MVCYSSTPCDNTPKGQEGAARAMGVSVDRVRLLVTNTGYQAWRFLLAGPVSLGLLLLLPLLQARETLNPGDPDGAIAAIGLDLVLGHTGLVSVGNAAFLAIVLRWMMVLVVLVIVVLPAVTLAPLPMRIGGFDQISSYVASGGTASGTGRYLKERNPRIKVWGIDTYGSVFKKYKETGVFDKNEIYPYITEGIGEDFLPKNVDFDLIDHFEKVTDKDAAIKRIHGSTSYDVLGTADLVPDDVVGQELPGQLVRLLHAAQPGTAGHRRV